MTQRPPLRTIALATILPPLLFAIANASAVSGCKLNASASASATSTTSTGPAKTPAIQCPEAPKLDGCTVAIAPSTDDYTTLETALSDADPNSVICLCPGTFSVDREIDLAQDGITIQGTGNAREDTVIDFAPLATTGASKAMEVTANGFTIQNLWVLNPPGDGVKVTGATRVTYRNLKASWSMGSSTQNGAYALYPVESSDVLIDTVDVEGAADAAIYVGQSTNAVVKNSTVHGSVAGIESENTTDMEIFNNEVFDNSAGVLVFALPNLTKKDALRTHVHDNHIHDNNHVNFGAAGSVVSFVPVGIGVLLLACDGAEIDQNTIENQGSGCVVVVSGKTLHALDSAETYQDGTDPFPENLFIHDNTCTGSGAMPASPLSLIPKSPLEDVIWDGDEATAGMGHLCLGLTNLPTFRDVNGIPNIGNLANQSTAVGPYTCVGTSLQPL